ncbi:MAG: FadR family transcriptional regulator [Mesorhizobium sp.]|nr:FCD domain-containing protein [Mesorhizobium sp.]MBL8576411.1 FadR family transcriptional regulator [Mesorhizobium sp.]
MSKAAIDQLEATSIEVADRTDSFGGGALERRSISEQVANRILSMIKSGNLKPGDRLPTEQQMTIAFGISRPPLREALKALTLMGVLSSRQGGRYTITDLSPSRLVAPFNSVLAVADYDVNQQFETRVVVDLELVRLCCTRASVEQRQRIHKLAVDGRDFELDPVAFRLLDIEYHQAINAGANNTLLAALAQVLYDLGLDVRRTASEVPGVIDKSVRQHVEIAEAIMRGDAPVAVAAYRTHLEHVRDTTFMAIAKRSQGPKNG